MAEWKNFTFAITDFQPQIKYGENVTIEVVIDKEYDNGIQVVAIGRIASTEILDMDRTILETAPTFLIRWSESVAKSQWSTPQSFRAGDLYHTENFGFGNISESLFVLVN